ncbi:MAG TPA: PTS sugar transporter subunit IIA [Candidatus Aminicenantes bacterium]|nr:PTS sugar transporter subunit IIA [Candidatus Aminicenantes bacterium]
METRPVPPASRFSDYLAPSQVVYDLKSKDKVEAIEELLDVLAKQKLIDNKKLLLTRIIDRENLVSTAIGCGVALPHARVDAGGGIAVAAGRSERGIDFDAHDGQKVHLIILVVWNPSLPGLFNHLFAGLARFLIRPENRGRILAAKDRAELYDILSKIEFRFVHEEKIVSRARLLKKLQELELKKKRKGTKDQQKELQKQAAMIREELDRDLLSRFDRLMERYGFAVADAVDGVCQGCNINISTQMDSAMEDSNDIYVCENCGKYLVSARKKKK